MEDAVIERLRQEGPDKGRGQGRPVEMGQVERGGVRQGRAAGPFQGQNPLAHAVPDDLGREHVAVAGHHFAQLVGAGRLQAQVEFELGGADHRLGEGLRLQPAGGGHETVHQAGGELKRLRILSDAITDIGPQHLHRHAAAVVQARVVGLGQGSGGHRLAELGEHALHRLAQRGLHLGAGLGHGEGRQLVLQARQVLGELRAEDVGAGGEKLAELDGHGAKRDEGRGQALARPAVPRLPAGQEAHGAAQVADRRRIEGLVLGRQQGVVPRQGPGGGQQASIGGGSRHAQMAQPWCRAATPPVKLVTLTRAKPASRIIWAKVC